MAVVHLFCTVVLVGIGQNWGDWNTSNSVSLISPAEMHATRRIDDFGTLSGEN